MSDFEIKIGDDFEGMSEEEIRAYYHNMTPEDRDARNEEISRRSAERLRIDNEMYAAQQTVIDEYEASFDDVLTLTEEDKRLLYDGTHPRFRFKSGNYGQYSSGHKLGGKDLEWKLHVDGSYSTKVSFTDGHSTFEVTLRSENNPHEDPLKPWLNLPDTVKAKWGLVVPREYKRFWVSEPEHTIYASYVIYAKDKEHLKFLLDNGILEGMDSDDRGDGPSDEKITFGEDKNW